MPTSVSTGDECVSKIVRCSNLGMHLLVATAGYDCVAVCLHAEGQVEAEESHLILDGQLVPWCCPDVAVSVRGVTYENYRKLAYEDALRVTGGVVAKAARLLGVNDRTIRNWRREGKL